MRFKLVAFFLLISLSSFSQIQNQDGQVIFQNGDSISGRIYYFTDTPNELIIYTNDVKKSFLLNQLKEVNLNNGLKFKSMNYPNENSNPFLFQKIISSHKISLYSKEKNGGLYFFVSKDNNIYKLENNDVYTKKDNKKYLSHDYKYIGTLKILMADQPKLYSDIDNTKINESSLCDIIINYNKGDISYYYYTINNAKRSVKSNWLLFGQYSNYANYVLNEKVAYSYGILAGTQINFTRNHRHSFKFNIGYSKYQMTDEYYQILALGFWYQYVFFRTERLDTYITFNILELSYIKEYDYQTDDNTDNFIYPVFRFSPGFGLEYKTQKHLSFYVELNNIIYNVINTSFIPSSFSLGIKYDIGSTARKHIQTK